MPTLSNANSGKITAPWTSQAVSPASATQTYWAVHNPNANADLWLGIGNAATVGPGSIRISPGATYDCGAVPQLTQAALSLLSGTVGAEFTIFNVA